MGRAGVRVEAFHEGARLAVLATVVGLSYNAKAGVLFP